MGKTRSTIFSRRKVVTDPKANKENEKVDVKKKSQNRQEFVTAIPSDKEKAEKSKPREKRASKQKSENNRSLKRMKNRGIVRQMLQSFPKEANSVTKQSRKAEPEAEENYDVPAELLNGQIAYEVRR